MPWEMERRRAAQRAAIVDGRGVMDDQIKVLGISGSPRRAGNTDLLLEGALKGAARRAIQCQIQV